MKIRGYTEKELKILQDNSKSVKECARLLNRSETAVQTKRQKLGVPCINRISDENKKILSDLSLSNKECVDKIDIDYNSVYVWRKRNLKSFRDNIKPFKKYTPEDIELLKDLSLTNRECAKILGRSVEGVITKRYTLGIKGYKSDSKSQ